MTCLSDLGLATRINRRAQLRRGFAPLAAVLLGGAAPPPAVPPPRSGTVAIEPKTADGSYDPALHLFTDAAGQALAARGFTLLDDPDHAAYVAELTVDRTDVGTGLARAPRDAPAMAGAGVVVPLATGKSNLVPLLRTGLALSIRRRGGGVVWHGGAVTVRAAGTRTGEAGAVAADLSAALLAGYPAEPRAVIGVP